MVFTGQGADVDTNTSAGKLVFGIFAALAEYGRALTYERTVAGGGQSEADLSRRQSTICVRQSSPTVSSGRLPTSFTGSRGQGRQRSWREDQPSEPEGGDRDHERAVRIRGPLIMAKDPMRAVGRFEVAAFLLAQRDVDRRDRILQVG